MNRMTDAIMTLREAAETVCGKIVSITLDENAYIEIDSVFQDCPPIVGQEVKKFAGIEIRKDNAN